MKTKLMLVDTASKLPSSQVVKMKTLKLASMQAVKIPTEPSMICITQSFASTNVLISQSHMKVA